MKKLLMAIIIGLTVGGYTMASSVLATLPRLDEIDRQIAGMSTEELVGQLFMPRWPEVDAAGMTGQYHPAGWVLFEKDFTGKTREEVQAMVGAAQDSAAVPLFMAVDEEGGTVVRVSRNPNLADSPFDSIQDVYSWGGLEGVEGDTRRKAQMLTGLGINMNLAPVCDVSTDPNDYIFYRTTGQDPATAAGIIGDMVGIMNDNRLYSSLKHFPGYGNNLNTHTGISLDQRPYEQFQTEDFLPFQAGINAGASSVLVSHNIVSCMDPDRPASLSPEVHRILREELGFENIIMTDDLSMDAITLYTGGQSPAVAAVLAGNDLLLTSDFIRDYGEVLAAVENGSIPREQVEESVKRILRVKRQYLYTE